MAEASHESGDKPHCSSSKNLLILLSGASLTSKEFVGTELQENLQKLCLGLKFYESPNLKSLKVLKEEKKVDGDLCKLIISLSKFLNLDEVICYDLLCDYLINDEIGEDFSLILSYERHLETFMLKVWNFYRWERLYLLLCVKTILAHHREQQHPYHDLFEEFLHLVDSNDNFEDHLFKQWDLLINSVITIHKLDSHSKAWMTFLLQEQFELLQIFLVFFKIKGKSAKRLEYLLNSFITHGFGLRQANGHLMDESMKNIVACISYIEVLILLENLHLQTLTDDIMNGITYYLKEDDRVWHNVDRSIRCMGSQKEHGLVQLAWAVVRGSVLGGEDIPTTRALAKSAQKLGAFSELRLLLKCSLFQGSDKISVCGYSIVYTLLSKLLSTFDESSIDELELLWEAVGDLLKNPVSAERFWIEGFESNLGLSISTLLGKFPALFSQPINLLSKLASSSFSSAKKVLSTLQNLGNTAIAFNPVMKLEETLTEDGCCFKLLQDYSRDGVYISAGCIGYQVAGESGREIIQWHQRINGIELSRNLLDAAVKETQFGSVLEETLKNVICITRFIRDIIEKLPSSYSEFHPLVDKVFVFVQRLAELHNFDKNIVTACLKLAAVIKKKPEIKSMWHYVVQTGILPKHSFVANSWNSENNVTAIGQNTISFILTSECDTGEYSTLIAFLSVISSYATILVDEDDDDYLASVAYVAREIFPLYSRWWYSSPEQKEIIAQLCLKTFHNILTFPTLKNGDLNRKVQKVVLSSLLHHDTGYSLLRVVWMGEEAIQKAIAQQTSWIAKSDKGLIHTIKLALSVLNRLLVVWQSGGKEKSPLIQSLCSEPVTAHIVIGYVNHRFDSRLATLAVQLLKQFATILPISLFVCLGAEASTFCRLLLRRLQTKVEDVRLKLAIFSLLEACVKFQPGITETFLGCDCDVKQDANQPKSECLKMVIDILRNVNKELCYTVELQAKALSFLKTLWISRQSIAVMDCKRSPDLWKIFVAKLFSDGPSRQSKADVCIIFSEECLFKDSDKKSSNKLIEELDCIVANGILPKWISGVYNTCIFHECSMQTETDNHDSYEDDSEANKTFLAAWKAFFIIGTKKGILNIAPGDRKTIFETTIKAVEYLLKNPNSDQLFILSEMLLHISNFWTRCLPNSEKLCDCISVLLCPALLDNDTVNINSVANIIAVGIKLLFGLIKHHNFSLDDQLVNSWIRVSCDVLQLSALSLDKGLCENKVDKAVTRVVFLISNLLKLLINICPKTNVWHDHLQKSSLINILLGFIVKSTRVRKAEDGCFAVLQLLSSFCNIAEICESILTVGTVQTLSLPLSQLQLNELEAGIKLSGRKIKIVSWNTVYSESIHLITILLHNKKHLVADTVMDFANVHLDIFQTIPSRLIQNLDISVLDISLTVLQFIHELSQYNSLWKPQTNSSLHKLLQITAAMGYISVAYLLRPRLISHLLGIEESDKLKDDDQGLYKKIFSNEDNSKVSGKLIEALNKLLRMSYLFVSIMCQFSPDLCELLADQGYDVGQWIPLLQLSFNTPSVDHIAPPSFGTVISIVTVCLRILTGGGDIPASPAQNPTSLSTDTQYLYDRELLTCLLEKSLYFVLSQACLNLLSSQQPLRDKEVFKRELGAELMSCIQSRYLKRGSAPSVSPAVPSPASALSPAHSRCRMPIDRWPFLNFISALVDSLFK